MATENPVFEVMRQNLALAQGLARSDSAYWRLCLEQKRNALGDYLADPGLWKDFRRNAISGALDNANALRPSPLHRRVADWFALRRLHRQARGKLAPQHWKYLQEIPLGGPQIHSIGGMRVSKSSLEFACMFAHLLPQLERCKVLVEIGGGYGGLARIIKDAFPRIAYVILDLPEVGAIQTYFLGSGGARIGGMRDVGAAATLSPDAQRFDYLLLPPPFIERLPPDSVDLVINTRSMMEMDLETVAYYFGQIQRCIRTGGAFYCLNRYAKLCRFRDYPFDERWQVAFSRPWPRFIDREPHHELLVTRSATPLADGARQHVRALPHG
jgi:putative sugar O-methyltransferase